MRQSGKLEEAVEAVVFTQHLRPLPRVVFANFSLLSPFSSTGSLAGSNNLYRYCHLRQLLQRCAYNSFALAVISFFTASTISFAVRITPPPFLLVPDNGRATPIAFILLPGTLWRYTNPARRTKGQNSNSLTFDSAPISCIHTHSVADPGSGVKVWGRVGW